MAARNKKEKAKATEEANGIRAGEATEPAEKSAIGFPVVGIGASAGGLAAFEAFFSGMPADIDPGMAFVLVQHLAPDHKSILTDLIRRYTRMEVFEVEDGMAVKPNCAYIIPPNRDMAFLNGRLQLIEPIAPRGQRLPIDFFFRSLAQDQHERAIGIVLSGTGSDGTLGVRAIKGEGGMIMAQTPASTEFDGMPRSAIATGLVDYELKPAEMPAQIMAYVAHALVKPPSRGLSVPSSGADNALKKILIMLRAQTGHDFSQYKPNTIHRRIERRMAVQQIQTIDGYLKVLQQMPAETEALFRDLLIGVTSFFRDPEAFKALEELAIPRLFAGKSPDVPIRVWSPGCSTGEEAYSIAILLQERLETLKQAFKIQIFATDIDRQAIAAARAGLYPASIAADLSPERLSRFFTAEADGASFRIHKAIRDMLVFSEQDVVKDPPFSRLDLISCRNLLIYMSGELQKKIIPLFYYAMNPGGFLFLGTSETVGEFGELFSVVDRKMKLYQCREAVRGIQRAALGRLIPFVAPDVFRGRTAIKKADDGNPSLRELAERTLLQQIAPAAALVNGHGVILYIHGRTGRYLESSPGDAGLTNILKMAREGLRTDLTAALHKAVMTREIQLIPGLRVKTNGDFSTVNLAVRPLTLRPAVSSPESAVRPGAAPEEPLFLVVMEEPPASDLPPAVVVPPTEGEGVSGPSTELAASSRIKELTEELRVKEQYLRTANEELETSNEELKSSNEEMQSVNEEMQSTNEELETSREELQSVNEELATVNAELQTKVGELSRASNDMSNLLASTGIGTLLLDHQLRILRYTPDTTRIIKLIPGDVGRPVGHIVCNLAGYDRLLADAQAVLDNLVHKELEVQTQEGEWYTMRILPFRTTENVIEGVVITFVQITARKKAEEYLKRSEKILGNTQRLSRIGGWEWNVEKQAMYWTEELYRLHDFEPGQCEPVSPEHIARGLACYQAEDRPVIQAAFQRCVEEGRPYDLELRFTSAKGRPLRIRTLGEPVMENGKVVRVIGCFMDITSLHPDDRPVSSEALPRK